MTTINPTTASSTGITATPKTTGAGSLTSNDFMNLMLKQLQNQDPLNPTDSNALLQQISQISTLQSNQTLQTSLTNMTLQQTIGSAGNLIGKTVQGIDANGNSATGAVTAVQVQNQQVYLGLDNGSVLPMSNVTAIQAQTAAAGANAGTSSLNNLMGLLQSLGLGA